MNNPRYGLLARFAFWVKCLEWISFTAEDRNTDRVRSTVTPVYQEREILKVARLTHNEVNWISAKKWTDQWNWQYQNLYKGGQPAELKLASCNTYFEARGVKEKQ